MIFFFSAGSIAIGVAAMFFPEDPGVVFFSGEGRVLRALLVGCAFMLALVIGWPR